MCDLKKGWERDSILSISRSNIFCAGFHNRPQDSLAFLKGYYLMYLVLKVGEEHA